MFLERTKVLPKDSHPFRTFRGRRWMPLLIVPVAACLAAPDTTSQNIASTPQAFTGRDVPSSHASSPNGQYTWSPKVGETDQKHIAVSPDGAFYLHTAGKSSTQFYVSRMALNDAIAGDSVDFEEFGANGAIALNQTRHLSIRSSEYKLGGLGAVSFDPRHGIGPFSIDAANDCARTAGSVEQVSVANGPIDCYRMVVYAQVRYESGTDRAYHVAIAPLHVAIDRGTNAIASAAFDDSFNRIQQNDGAFVNARSNDKDEFSDHFTATADGRLIVFDSKPYYSWSPDPLALNNFEPRTSFWEITDLIRENPVRLGGPLTTACTSPEEEGCVRFDQAYPVFRTPFQFVDNTPFAADNPGCGYPWITPDGTDLFCNAGSISVLAMIGQSTAGTLQHIDAPVQTTQQRYCKETAATPPAQPISCTLEALGTRACSPRGTSSTRCGGDAQTTLGSQRVTSIGAASGSWKIRTSVNGELTRFPLMHRTPSLLMMSRNTALSAFGLDAPAQAASFLYFEVATDAAVDPDFLAFFHMNEAIMPIPQNEAIMPIEGGERSNLAPFGDTNPAQGLRAEHTADVGGHGFVGTLNGCAQFPFDRFGRIEHRTNAPPNPGFIGRAIYFRWPDGKVDIASSKPGHRLLEQRSAMTLELAVKPQNLPSTMGKTVLVSAPGSFELSFERTQGTSGVVTNVTFAATGATAPVTFANIDIPSDNIAPYTGPYTHLVLTYEGSATANQATTKLYRNGEFAGSATLTGANSLPSRPSGAAPLCIGPGCGTGISCNLDANPMTNSSRAELLIDEVAISAVVRAKDYIAAAAAVEGPVDVFVPSEMPSWFPSLPLGLETTDIRIPKAIADEINASTNKPQKFARIAALGKALFIDDVLSVNPPGVNVCGGRTVGRTCSFCHLPGGDFANPGVRFDVSVDNTTLLDTNTPSLLNRVFSTRQLKDRSESSLVHQAESVIANQIEMHGNLAKVAACLNRTNSPENMPAGYPPADVANYREWFNYAFAGSKDAGNSVTQQQVVVALATYELTLVSGNSAVDQMLAPGGTGTEVLREGLRIFQGKGRCAGCHSGANFTDELPHVTTFGGKAVKTPSLRNVAATNPYFHNGGKASLRTVIEHYNRCGAVKLSADSDPIVVWSACAPELVALGLTDGGLTNGVLTDEEMDALEAFLVALTSNP